MNESSYIHRRYQVRVHRVQVLLYCTVCLVAPTMSPAMLCVIALVIAKGREHAKMFRTVFILSRLFFVRAKKMLFSPEY